jgi:hypothetical protein
MKLPFRFFRGEFNGHYLYKALTCLNDVIKDVLDELAYHATVQWKTAAETSPGETPLRDEDLFNLGRIAGLYPDNLLGRTTLGSIGLTQSYIVAGKQRSERALMDMESGSHRFVRTEQDDYPDDIVTDASPDRRIGFIPAGTEPVGYVPMGTPIYDDEGGVLWENLLYEPPTDGTPYAPFYGEKYLVHEEWFVKDSPLSPETFKELLECMLWVRRNGPSLGSFFTATRILTTGVVHNIEITPHSDRYYLVRYDIDPNSTIRDQDRLVASWLWVIRDKFKLFVPELRMSA